MRNWNILLLAAAGMIIISCSDHHHEEPAEHGGGTAVTIWTTRTELFAEFPFLEEQTVGSVAIHLTDLSTFQPVVNGNVIVSASAAGQAVFNKVIEKPSSPGIYRAELRFPRPGEYTVSVIVASLGNDTIIIQGIRVHPRNSAPPEEAAHVAGNEISFLKEQQWKTSFRTADVSLETVEPTLYAYAEIVPSAGGEAVVTAPFSGFLSFPQGMRPKAPGVDVKKGEILASLTPAVETASGSEDYVSRLADASAAKDLAAAERDRNRQLFEKGVLSHKEYLASETEWKRADARFRALSGSAQQDDDHGTAQGKQYRVRAPLSGSISHV